MSNQANILIVEDSLTQAIQLQDVLERNGYSVAVAGNGQEGLDHLNDHLPELVISDIVMPEMDGYEMCRNIRREERLRDLPVVLLTSLNDPEEVFKALECGADNFITKPYEHDYLISRIKSILVDCRMRGGAEQGEGIRLFFGGQERVITSDPRHMVGLLLSTYDHAIRKNRELVQMNEKLTSMQQELEKRNCFLGMAAHDLRSPLGAISYYSEELLGELHSVANPDQMEFLTTIKSTSEFSLQLVNELLDISKIESGKVELNLKPTDIQTLTRNIMSLNRVKADEKGIELHLACEQPIPTMMLDGPKFQQVLNNLISNAVKYSHSESSVVVNLEQQDDRIDLFVRDEGQGIPANEIETLFRPFELTSVESTAGEARTGLGLVITKSAVEWLGGKIRVESEVGKGTTFYVSIPFRPVPKSVVDRIPSSTQSKIGVA